MFFETRSLWCNSPAVLEQTADQETSPDLSPPAPDVTFCCVHQAQLTALALTNLQSPDLGLPVFASLYLRGSGGRATSCSLCMVATRNPGAGPYSHPRAKGHRGRSQDPNTGTSCAALTTRRALSSHRKFSWQFSKCKCLGLPVGRAHLEHTGNICLMSSARQRKNPQLSAPQEPQL